MGKRFPDIDAMTSDQLSAFIASGDDDESYPTPERVAYARKRLKKVGA